jgi:hypothetical protein
MHMAEEKALLLSKEEQLETSDPDSPRLFLPYPSLSNGVGAL